MLEREHPDLRTPNHKKILALSHLGSDALASPYIKSGYSMSDHLIPNPESRNQKLFYKIF
jgi:hypothetical protein